MKNDTNAPAAFPQERNKRVKDRRTVWLMAGFGLIAFMVISGMVGAAVGYSDSHTGKRFSQSNAPWFMLLLSYLAMLPALWWTSRYWKSIDELAKRVHLDAFLWGGGTFAWMIFTPLIVPMIGFSEFKVAIIEDIDGTATHVFGLGAFSAIMITLLGYGVYWLISWAAKR
jgi:hypothetical protein